MNVTGMPEQTGLLEAKIKILTGIFALTVIVIVLDVAGLLLAQRALELRMQES